MSKLLNDDDAQNVFTADVSQFDSFFQGLKDIDTYKQLVDFVLKKDVQENKVVCMIKKADLNNDAEVNKRNKKSNSKSLDLDKGHVTRHTRSQS